MTSLALISSYWNPIRVERFAYVWQAGALCIRMAGHCPSAWAGRGLILSKGQSLPECAQYQQRLCLICTVETQSDITYVPTYVSGASTCSTIILRPSTRLHSVVPKFSHVHIKCGNERNTFQFAMTIFDSTVAEPESSSETRYETKLLVNASCNLSYSND